jgi:glucose-6-phosphate 1-epimerase
VSGEGAAGAALAQFRGQPAVLLRAPDGASAVVLMHGAQVVSWRPAGGDERLFLSERSRFGAGASVRGGMPVIFPQFNERGTLPRHGFARTRAWSVVRSETGVDDALAVLQLTDDEATRALWPHRFVLELTVCVRGDRLDVELAVSNAGDDAFAFMAALHTYLQVAEVGEARLAGLQGCRYEDFAAGTSRVDDDDAVRVDAEIDRIYHGAPTPLVLGEARRRLRIEAANFPDVVVWNPGQEKAAAMADLQPADYRRFLCVEAALIGSPVRLDAGGHWWGRQTLVAG